MLAENRLFNPFLSVNTRVYFSFFHRSSGQYKSLSRQHEIESYLDTSEASEVVHDNTSRIFSECFSWSSQTPRLFNPNTFGESQMLDPLVQIRLSLLIFIMNVPYGRSLGEAIGQLQIWCLTLVLENENLCILYNNRKKMKKCYL